MRGLPSHEWPESGSQGACDWPERQGEMVKDANNTSEDGGYVTQEFRSYSPPNWYRFVCSYCFTHLHLSMHS